MRFFCLLLGLCTAAAVAQGLPAEVESALARAKVPREALSVLVVEAQGEAKPRLALRTQAAMNPASVMKLVTTTAALDLLGPSYSWRTPVYLEGAVREGTLYGNLYIQGQGDPKLVMERLWLLMRRVQGLGIRHIAGDVVLDRSAFHVPARDLALFDGEPLRPYNAAPDALLLNYQSVVLTFNPDPSRQLAQVQLDPPLAGVQAPSTVPLREGECGDYRSALQLDFSDAQQLRLRGSYPTACGEKSWALAYPDPERFALRAVQGMWQSMGGTLHGSLRWGTVPSALLAAGPALEGQSPPLSEVVREINKFSNNVMAQQLFLTLGLAQGRSSYESARSAVQGWWEARLGAASGSDAPVLDNGSGLSRQERSSAQALGRLLRWAYAAPLMPDLMASLPLSGVDGTLRRMQLRNNGSAHLKTGTLRDVLALAGYVHSRNGTTYVLVALINHPNAPAARPAIAALVDWVVELR